MTSRISEYQTITKGPSRNRTRTQEWWILLLYQSRLFRRYKEYARLHDKINQWRNTQPWNGISDWVSGCIPLRLQGLECRLEVFVSLNQSTSLWQRFILCWKNNIYSRRWWFEKHNLRIVLFICIDQIMICGII